MDSQRALAAIVFTDAVGFSGRANLDEAEALEKIERDFAVMRESCARHDGQVLKSLGDGLLMVFSSAVQAVLCAIDMQDRLQKGGEDEPLLHRIGIHLGDVLLSASDAQGDGVNIASRLEQEAPPGGICMSGTIYDVVKSRLTVQVRSRGVTQLKNIAEPIQVYEIGPSAETVEKVSLKRRLEPGRQAMGTTYAIFFLGICILAAAGIYFISNRKQGPEPLPFPFGQMPERVDPESAARIFRMTPEGSSDFKGDPKSESFKAEIEKIRSEILSAIPKDFGMPEEAKEKGNESKASPATPKAPTPGSSPASVGPGETTGVSEASVKVPTPPKTETPSVVQVEEFVSYEQAREAYADGFEFEKMLAWVIRQPWSSKPGGGLVLRHWEKLVEMKAFIFEGVNKLGGQAGEVEGGEIPPMDTLRVALSKMKPNRFRALAVGIAAKTEGRAKLRPLLTEFDLEYTGGGLDRLVKTLTAK